MTDEELLASAASAAYDILTDAGYPPAKAALIAVTAQRDYAAGKITRTPEEFARHMVKIRKALKGS